MEVRQSRCDVYQRVLGDTFKHAFWFATVSWGLTKSLSDSHREIRHL